MRPKNYELDLDVQKALTGTSEVEAIIPEVWSQEIEEAARPNRVMRGLIVLNTELLNSPGDIVHIPKLGTLVANDLTETTGIVPEAWDATTTVDLIPDEVGAGVEVTRKALRRAYISVMEAVTKELGEALATKEDKDIIEAAVAGAGLTIFSNGTGVDDITADDIFTVSLFKDAIEALESANAPEPYMCLVHPAVKRALLEDEQFVNASTYGGSEVVRTGEIGEYLGVKVFKSTQAPHAPNTGTVEVYTSLFWGKRGICEALKAEPDFQDKYEPLDRAHTLASVMEYDTKVLNDDQVVVVKSAGGGGA